jgi:hypothetical protein
MCIILSHPVGIVWVITFFSSSTVNGTPRTRL